MPILYTDVVSDEEVFLSDSWTMKPDANNIVYEVDCKRIEIPMADREDPLNTEPQFKIDFVDTMRLQSVGPFNPRDYGRYLKGYTADVMAELAKEGMDPLEARQVGEKI
ncbi:MAG: hypothetical protein Q9226_008015, partial [Calogaya cf. arnoldii]